MPSTAPSAAASVGSSPLPSPGSAAPAVAGSSTVLVGSGSSVTRDVVERPAVVERRLAHDSVGRQLVELGVDDDPFASRVLRMAGGEHQGGLGRVGGGDHLVVARRDDLLTGDPIHEAARQRGDDDLIAVLHLVDVEERLTECGAVPCDRSVAELARQWRLGVVARTLLEIVLVDPGNHDLVDADSRKLEVCDASPSCRSGGIGAAAVATGSTATFGSGSVGSGTVGSGTVGSGTVVVGLGRVGGHLGGCRDCAGRLRWARQQLLELVLERILGPGGFDAGSPQLVRDESEHEQSGGDQHLADAADPPAPVLRRWWPIELADAARLGSARRRTRFDHCHGLRNYLVDTVSGSRSVWSLAVA